MYFKSILTSVFAFTFWGSAQAAATYQIQLNASANELSLTFSSKEIFSSMCGLDVLSVTLEKPKANSFKSAKGLISLTAAKDPMAMCAMSFGPHTGNIVLSLGRNLPMLVSGNYDLNINGDLQGVLTVDGADSQYVETKGTSTPVEILFDGYIDAARANIKTLSDGTKQAYLVLELRYGGGCKAHVFDLNLLNICTKSYPPKCKAQLIHTEGADNTCEMIVTEEVTFQLDSIFDKYELQILGATERTTASVFVDLTQ